MIRSVRTSCLHCRQGSVYILVLGMAMLVSIVGLSVLTFARLKGREILWANNSKEASVLAESAVEWALTKLAADTNWRTTYNNGVETSPVPLGNGTMSFKLVDEGDGNLANKSGDPARIYGIGRAGVATRIYSAELTPNGPGLDVLKTVAHAGGDMGFSSTVVGTGGAFSSNSTLTVPSLTVVNGDVEAPTLSIVGTVNGVTRTVAAKVMPSADVFDDYLAVATEIPFLNILGGAITLVVLSPAVNPYGSVNAGGVYHIRVPAGASLTVRQARLVATLLVTLESGAKFTTSNAWHMERPRPDSATLIIRCLGVDATVDLNGSPNSLKEASVLVNFNPPGTPYPWPSGTADLDLLDTYPVVACGLLHIICPPTVTTDMGSSFTAKGTVIAEGPILCGSNSSLTGDPNLYANPPAGYRMPGPMRPTPSSWRWEEAQ